MFDMRKILWRLKRSRMFIIMFLITVFSIISVTITITWTTIRMSEDFFIETFSITNAKVLNQIKDNFESFNYSVVIASNNFLQSGTMKQLLSDEILTNFQLMNAYYDMRLQINRVKSNFNTYEVGIMVSGSNGIGFATDSSYWSISAKELEEHSITMSTINEPYWLKYHFYQSSDELESSKIIASRAFIERSSGSIYGTMYFSYNESELRKFYNSFTSPGNDIFVLNRSGIIVSSNHTKQIGEKAEELLGFAIKLAEGSETHIKANLMGKNHIVLSEYLPTYDMYLINLIDRKTAIGNFVDKKAIALISMSIVVVALIIVFFISRKMTNSLSRLVKQIENAPKKQFHEYVRVSGMYETRQIGNAFNAMLDELHEYVDQLVLSQKQKQEADLAALQQQINPHFLYNTLTSIKFMVQQVNKEDADNTINALISLLQNTIGNVDETVSVNQELENLKNYVFINQKRYGNRIKVNYFVDPKCVDYQIPKLILQPFIENSFFHAFNQKAEGYINVLVWQEGEMLICEIVDNGDGMEISREHKLPNTKRNQQLFSGIGVKNVNDRIQLIYGEPYGVTISSKLGEGTKVRISFPVNKKIKNLKESQNSLNL
jgi:two-component system, sensor histidine kinase YesM